MSRASDRDSFQTLKAQLAEKEFKLSELENRVKDLFNEANELDEKLRISNRNARVLEEENSNYHMKLKSIEKDEDISKLVPSQKEAIKLVKENEDLRARLADAEEHLKAEAVQIRESDSGADKQIRALSSECERMRKERQREVKELENTRFQCAELQKRLDDEHETLKTARDLWDQERERYHQKIDELLEHNKSTVRSTTPRTHLPKGTTSDEPLEQVLLKEDVAQLEQKLKDVQERLWGKEKEWIRTENELRKKFQSLQLVNGSEGRNDKALFQAMKDQIRALQDEIKALRNDRLASRSAVLGAAAASAAASKNPASTVAQPLQGSGVANWAARYDAACKEKEAIQDQLDAAKATILALQHMADDKTISCKELEVQIAALRKKEANGTRRAIAGGAASTRSVGEQSFNSRASTSSNAVDAASTISQLKQRIRVLENELTNLKNDHEQKETISSVRTKEYQMQVDELLRENAALRNENGDTCGTAESASPVDSMDGVIRLTKDKRESVEEVMRLLEFSWDSDEEAKRQLRRAKYQSASMAGQDAAKDDEIRRLQKTADDLENQLQDMEKKGNDVDELKDAVSDLRKQLRGLQAENDKLRKKNGDLEKSRNDAAKGLAAKEEDANRRNKELQKEVEDLKRRLADARKPSSRSGSPAVSPRTPRTPRIAARRRTPEVPAMSQLSVRSTEEQRRSAVPEGAHLAFTVVELADVLRNGRPITEPGYVVIKLKSIKEKYKTSVKGLSSVIRFDETFVFYLAQPDQDVITVHVFYQTKNGSREYHIGDACFSMATLYRGVPRQRIAPVVQNPGTKDARRAGQIEVNLQTDDFGKTMEPTEDEMEDERARFDELVNKYEHNAPEKLHAADVYMASEQL
ncbi:putative mitochondrial C2 domain containing protein (CC2D) [Leptomonas pyrrhocoris]|uniref:Putative mitochondrial C2 domain containing protein (CC2D) n=1 Tax=Leptomonas pyrrhocoris TaxID=157538 RepID=A0A0M9G4L7_LEPPY|nr:putative mitochondrial C2 domain containing protein (CC2D) [Leptomonas pyrrhocoris]XP_015660760.1 putative mitochondrial C2 domain containing protein (CC2D) [Leptomonas pyrrhocoris]KPA82320.1 putative mitochondrial C2 domain containing protein (CC2D) [Leptomonas pyrrhocoris]KPA82321.1 putative mitochondrial C2 domain containing protein (CC2D) [Leptomonas pyrrhocoris]|eukprot:XP_015660759.1 putative mitochondrial C2 domain containing protein (CC2D) [Leptomonas pyrrhocoris]